MSKKASVGSVKAAWQRPALYRMGVADAEAGGMMTVLDQFNQMMMMNS